MSILSFKSCKLLIFRTVLAEHKLLDTRNLKAGNSSAQIFLPFQFNSAHLSVWSLLNSTCREAKFTAQLSGK